MGKKYFEEEIPGDCISSLFRQEGFETKRKRSETKRNREQSDLDESFSKDLTVGRVARTQYMNNSYWKWDGGSSLLFLRWLEYSRRIARDGIPPYIINPLSVNHPKTRPISADHGKPVFSKILVCIQKGYIALTSDKEIKST